MINWRRINTEGSANLATLPSDNYLSVPNPLSQKNTINFDENKTGVVLHSNNLKFGSELPPKMDVWKVVGIVGVVLGAIYLFRNGLPSPPSEGIDNPFARGL